MQRFFVPPDTLAGSTARLTGDTARQIIRVLRMQPGDYICLLDGVGWEYLVRLDRFGKDDVAGEIMEKREGEGEPAHKITLYLSLLNKPDKFEWALQKCSEIGAAVFTPIHAARSISDRPGAARKDRWEKIIQEAAEQSHRAVLPILNESMTFAQAIAQEIDRLQQGNHVALMPTLGAALPMSEAIRGNGATMSIFIGPEGGFTPDEAITAQKAGITPITLGPRTLRAETAAVAALTMVLYELGEMG